MPLLAALQEKANALAASATGGASKKANSASSRSAPLTCVAKKATLPKGHRKQSAPPGVCGQDEEGDSVAPLDLLPGSAEEGDALSDSDSDSSNSKSDSTSSQSEPPEAKAAEDGGLRLVAGDDARCAWLAVRTPGDENELPRVCVDDLQEAAMRGDLETMRRLIASGVSVNAPIRPESEHEYMCLLHVLASKPEIEGLCHIAGEVIKGRANLNVRSSFGSTPLSLACMIKHVEFVEVLLDSQADVRAIDDEGRTALACAVVIRPDEDSDEEVVKSVNIVELFGDFDIDLDEGGDEAPIITAVTQQRVELVTALLEGGATADGLVEAVDTSEIEIIEKLVEAEVNPFKQDVAGRLVMDIALARGSDEITCLLRDYIGDLQRRRHRHVKTLDEYMKREQHLSAQALLVNSTDMRNAVVLPLGASRDEGPSKQQLVDIVLQRLGLEALVDRWSHVCRRVNKNSWFQNLMFVTLIFALFLPDAWVLFDVPTNDALDVLLLVILFIFLGEFWVQLIGFCRSYTFTFFFWMDLLGVLSIPLDHSVVVDNLPSGLDNTSVMRAARMAKLGARAGRFTKLVARVRRYLSGAKDEEESKDSAKAMSVILNRSLTVRVSSLIIMLVFILPCFEMLRYPKLDASMLMWANQAEMAARFDPGDLAGVLSDFQAAFAELKYFPFQVNFDFPNGTSNSQMLFGAEVPVRLQNQRSVRSSGGLVEAVFSFELPHKIDSVCNIAMIFVIISVLILSVLILSNTISRIAMVPLAGFFEHVRGIGAKIFDSVANLTGKEGAEDEDEAEEETNKDPMGAEAKLLEKVLDKITVLSEITMKASPLDAEQLKQLDERDKALLQGYGGVQQSPTRNRPSDFESLGSQASNASNNLFALADIRNLLGPLEEAGVSREAFGSWDLNVIDISEAARQRLCVAMLAMRFPLPDANMSGPFSKFIEKLAAAYRRNFAEQEKPAIFHSWAHAVDVGFVLMHTLHLCGAEKFLTQRERFALVLAAVCHDVGHWGVNNSFLAASHHELAIRYNDNSAIENFSASKAFEITRLEGCDVFQGLSGEQVKEVRHVVIEGILHTDFVHHNAMVKELQTFVDILADVLDKSEDNRVDPAPGALSKEMISFLRGADVKRQLRASLVHIADISYPTKPWSLAQAWANLMIQEMLNQGDVEKQLGLPVGPLNDRSQVHLAYSQIGFIHLFVAPMVQCVASMMPAYNVTIIRNLTFNLDSWFRRWVEDANPDQEDKTRIQIRIAEMTPGTDVGKREMMKRSSRSSIRGSSVVIPR